MIALKPSLVAAILLAVAAAGCGDSPTAPTTTSPATTPVTESYSSQLAVQGTSSRSFQSQIRGTVRVTLTATQPGNVTIGLGVGIPRANGSGCLLSASLATQAAAAPQLVMDADAGPYCVQVYDLGTLTDPVGFTVSIVHP